MRWHVGLLMATVAVLGWGRTGAAQGWLPGMYGARLVAPHGEAGDRFGYSVALTNDTLVVGAPEEATAAGHSAGSVYVFERSGKTWALRQRLTASDGSTGARFGTGVSIEGETLVVGAPLASTSGGYTGAAYVFVRVDGTWAEHQRLEPSDGATGDCFAWHVSLSGDGLLVGAHARETGAGEAAGAAYIFERTGQAWLQSAELVAPDGDFLDVFGWAVSLSGSTALVGAGGHETKAGDDSGAAYVFVRTASTWTLERELMPSPAAAGDRFGDAVSISGDTALIGASGTDTSAGHNAGVAYMFVRSASKWSQALRLQAPDGDAGDAYGAAVAISGDVAAISATTADTLVGDDTGVVYLLARSGKQWQQVARIAAAGGTAGDRLGSALSVVQGTVAMGSHLADPDGKVDAGAVYVAGFGAVLQ